VLSSTTSIYVPDGGQNFANHNDPKIKQLYDRANVELDSDERADIMNEIDEVLWDGMPTIPLFQVPELLAWRSTVDGPEYNGYIGPTWNANVWSLTK
jgi:peptide/nickel transport system substrate-binding protein